MLHTFKIDSGNNNNNRPLYEAGAEYLLVPPLPPTHGMWRHLLETSADAAAARREKMQLPEVREAMRVLIQHGIIQPRQPQQQQQPPPPVDAQQPPPVTDAAAAPATSVDFSELQW